MLRSLSLATAFAALSMTSACAQEQSGSVNRAEVEEIVRDYILENPQIIEDALILLTERQQAENDEKARRAMSERADDLFNDARDFSIGPADAEVTMVEFFDYRCGYCKASLDWVQGLPEETGGKVRVVFKELPILSAESEQAALAALAAGEQGKYMEMHAALMRSRSPFKEADIDKIAAEVGVDVAKMRADMKSTEVRKHVADVRSLAQAIGASATPTFIIDGQLIAGFDRARLEAIIDELT